MTITNLWIVNKNEIDIEVTEIYADKAGNIWFCTDAGTSRYDGKSFKNFTTKDGLSSNSVNRMSSYSLNARINKSVNFISVY